MGGREGGGAASGYSLLVGVLVSVMMTSVFVNRYMLRFVTSHRSGLKTGGGNYIFSSWMT